MAKVALLIGVSEYEPGLNPLPNAVKDIAAMERVLQNPQMGGFAETDVKLLQNPDSQAMAEAIENLFSNRKKDDLVFLFFSGHGVKDDSGKLYLTTSKTRKSQQGELVRSTAVPASFVQDSMSRSSSKRQVVVLDCCFSGAFAEGMFAKDDGSVDIKSQLGGEGRAILTSSTSTQYSFEKQGSDLSVYTRYLVEGLETGAADIDSDGNVSIDELHEYAKQKVQEEAPAMKPEIYAIKEGFKIYLAKAPTDDPKLRYRKEVERFASRGSISSIARKALEAQREKLRLSSEESSAIEDEVLKPYREYKQNLQQYEQEFVGAIQREYPLTPETRSDLKYLQQVLGLRDEDILPSEQKLIQQKTSAQLPVSSLAESGSKSAFNNEPLQHQPIAAEQLPKHSTSPKNLSPQALTGVLPSQKLNSDSSKSQSKPESSPKNSKSSNFVFNNKLLLVSSSLTVVLVALTGVILHSISDRSLDSIVLPAREEVDLIESAPSADPVLSPALDEESELAESRPSPEQFMRDYYSNVNDGNLDKAWSMLTRQFQEARGGRDEYNKWWGEGGVNVQSVLLINQAEETARVDVQIQYLRNGSIDRRVYILKWNANTESWQIDASQKI
jgi:uncharacterized caspase-like protein